MFLVLLRIAIGWHFLYEGTQKILSTPWGKTSILARVFPVPEGPTFSSEGYLRNSAGPLAPRFRALIPDADSREKLKVENVKRELIAESKRVIAHYGFEGPRKEEAEKVVSKAVAVTENWFQSVENAEKVKKYLDELAEVEEVEHNPDALSYERSNAWADRKTAETDRRELVKITDSWTDSLRDALTAVAKKDLKRVEAAGPYQPEAPWTTLAMIDLLTMWGLSAVGLCLMLGLFTPLAALARRSGVPPGVLPQHAPLARPPRRNHRGALSVRQQEPDRDARLPGAGEHAQRPLDRLRRLPLRLDRPGPPAG